MRREQVKYVYALGAGAILYFILGGSSALSGGASGSGGGKKVPEITGFVYPGTPSPSQDTTSPYASKTYVNPTPSPYIQAQMDKKSMYQSQQWLASSQEKTVGGSSVSPAFFAASTTPTYEFGGSPSLNFVSSNPNPVAAKAENIAYNNTSYGQLGKAEYGSQYTKKESSSSSSGSTILQGRQSSQNIAPVYSNSKYGGWGG
jgi:hypothetical protein